MNTFRTTRRGALAAVFILALAGVAACGGGGDERRTVAAADMRARPLAVDSTPLTEIPFYTITNLSLGLGDVGANVQPQGINASGQVAGSVFMPNGARRAFFYNGSEMIDLGTLGGTTSEAVALNDSGQVTGYSDEAGNASRTAFIWEPGGSLVRVAPNFFSGPRINNAGLVVGNTNDGGFMWSEAGGLVHFGRAFQPRTLNSAGQMVGSGFNAQTFENGGAIRQLDGTVAFVYPFSRSSDAYLINDSALVSGIGSLTATPFQPRVFTWQAGINILHGDALATSSADTSNPRDLNQIGQLVGSATHIDPATGTVVRQTGFMATSSTLINDIGNLGGEHPRTVAYAINNHGQAVGQSSSDTVVGRAITWTAATGIVDLNTRLLNPPPGLHLQFGFAISDNGSIVVSSNAGMMLLKPVQVGPPPTAAAVGPITGNDPAAVSASVTVGAGFTDSNTSDTHTASWSWGDGAMSSAVVNESGGAGTASGSHTYSAAGVYTVMLTVIDSSGRSATVTRDVVIYDPSGGFVTGNGWINSPTGAYRADTALAGRADFAFVSKYKKGATTPDGETEFQFQTAQLNFVSNTYDWLVVAGARAQYKGSGSLNGLPGHKFLLTAVDGALLAKGTRDRFRIKIWHTNPASNTDVIDYDNLIDASAEGGNSEGTAIGAGSIVVHK